MRGRLAVAVPSAIRPLPMHQALGQPVAPFVRKAEPCDRIERVALLRPASAIAPLDYRNAFGASMLRHRALRFDLHVEGAIQPTIEDLLTHREQRFIPRRIANLREHCQRPMRTAPRGVHMRLANEPRVPFGNQRSRARRRPDFLAPLPNFTGLRIFPDDASHDLPSNRRLVALQQLIDESTSISFHDRRAHSDNSELTRSNAAARNFAPLAGRRSHPCRPPRRRLYSHRDSPLNSSA